MSPNLDQHPWKTVALVAAVAAIVGGVSYLALSGSGSPPPKVKSSKRQGKSKSLKSKSTDAIATEPKEKAPVPVKAAAAKDTDHVTEEKKEEKKDVKEEVEDKVEEKAAEPTDEKAIPDEHAHLFVEDIESLSEEERAALAKEAKTVGNRLFGERKYENAIKYYTQAINLHQDAIFYANRAACWSNLNKHAEVIEDCNKALEKDSRYIKAMHRRAQAYIATDRLEDALKDYTAICMLEEFKKESSLTTTDRLLRDIGKKHAAELMKQKTPRLPSETFIRAYVDSFRPNKTYASWKPQSADDALVLAALELVQQRKWHEAAKAIDELVTKDLSTNFKALAYNLHGTFAFLRGDTETSLESFNTSIKLNPNNVNTRIKRASLFMEKGDIESTLREYLEAEEADANDADLYYHRGQVRFLTGDLDAAIADYKKSLALDNNFVYAHIQLGVALYRSEEKTEASNIFKNAAKIFKDSAEVYNYHGEILLDQENYAEAETSFDKAISMNPNSPLPYINKSILYIQWKRDAPAAEQICRKATEVDPLCDIAFIQLAQLLIHQNKLEEALEVYDKAIKITRTEPELVNAVSCREAAAAQLYVSLLFPDVYEKLKGLSSA
ncbi:TOM (translocase of outer membrane) complex component [Chytridiales sp. JEL 0842]|nr:TOM (translocase of outer membrane) complex component [Chytridiales sp. JEL 0842]